MKNNSVKQKKVSSTLDVLLKKVKQGLNKQQQDTKAELTLAQNKPGEVKTPSAALLHCGSLSSNSFSSKYSSAAVNVLF